MNRTWSIVLWLVGEAILIVVFMQLGLSIEHINYQLLINFFVSSVILTVVMMSMFRNTTNLAKRGIGNGMKWFFTLTYALLSLGTMFYFSVFNAVDLLTQTIVQLIFLSVLSLGMWGAFNPNKKSDTSGKVLSMERNQLAMLRNVVSVAKSKAERRADIPENIRQDISTLQMEIHHIEPVNEYSALKMEGTIMQEMNTLLQELKQPKIDLKRLQHNIKSCFKMVADFKETYQA